VLEVILLDDMDWFEFEQFVAHLFEKLGLGKAEEIRKGRDAGKDIILRSPQGLLIVECKHHPKGSVGRPVVQKLHSAVISANAIKGFVVTTGHFSENETTYARSLGSIIELVDSRILSDMANKARVRVLKKGEKTSVFHVLPPPQRFIEQKMLSSIIGNAFSFPNEPSQLSKTEVINTQFVPAYLLEYSLNQNFSTTVGIIHRIHVNKERLLLNGQDGSIIASQLCRMVSPASMVEDRYSLEQKDVFRGSFKIGYSTAKRLGTRHIRKRHTTTVGYYGANNVHYTKKCTPNVSNILIRSLTQVYIPVLTVSFQIVAKQHKISLCGNPEVIEILDGAVYDCEICGNPLSQERLLCNSCGKIVHKPQFIMGHSFFCELCNKTICKECTYWTRKYLFFKKKLCKNCAEKLHREGKTVKKL
jgi:restriction system protein